ncbi:hypothetical protein T4D_3385 [Trichinella pseudospiralis]|uniref:Uncharacterized protein n=1 Tax=Trichinella pseudospiralis TaxID=6337 RepID=A0A0V1FQG1_TRIPS|nr:hypothetical protein T4D_3385 [Trichinella pseudospiralis]
MKQHFFSLFYVDFLSRFVHVIVNNVRFAVICHSNVCIAKVTSTNALQFLFDIHHPSMAATVTDEMWPAGIHTAGQMHMGYF